MKQPGSAGLTSDRLGDSDMWTPDTRKGSSGSMLAGDVVNSASRHEETTS